MSVTWFGKQVYDRTVKVTEDNMKKACMSVYADSVNLCPTDTGRLKGSLDWAISTQQITQTDPDKIQPPSSGSGEIVGIVGSNVNYAIFVELGNSNPNYPKQPYLMPALHNNKDVILRLFSGGFDR